MQYNMVIDFGIPYQIEGLTRAKVSKEIESLKNKYNSEDCPYSEVNIYDETGKEVTNEFFKEIKQPVTQKKKELNRQRCLQIPECNCWKCQINNI